MADKKVSPLAAIVLAAGLSSRMGQFKLLLPWLNEQPILVHIVEKATSLSLATVLVVTGHRADDVQDALAAFDVTFVHNPDYAEGEILSSMKAGLRALPDDIAAAMVVPGDLPRIPLAVMEQVRNAYQPQTIVAPRYDGQRGHPVLIGRHYWQSIFDLPPTAMPRDALQAHRDRLHLIDVNSDGILADVDTPEAYKRELQRARRDAESAH